MTDRILLVGTRKGMFVARGLSGDDMWEMAGPHFPGVAFDAVAVDSRRDPPRLLAGGTSDVWGPNLVHSDDLGATWVEPDRAPISFPPETDAIVERFWQLRPGPADEPGRVWAGVQPAALFRSDDDGDRFELVRGLWDHPHRPQWVPGFGGLGLHTILPHPDDRDRMVVAISAGGVYRTTDGASTWVASNSGLIDRNAPDPEGEFGHCVHKVAPDATDPDVLYQQFHGGVYRSDDGGSTWVGIADGLPSDFGFPVVAHPRRSGVVYLVPLTSDGDRTPPGGRFRIYRSEDRGDTWEPLTEGLPQKHAYLNVLRDAFSADDADPVGLYCGTRQGELFASFDDGDRWTSLFAHLPDILSVRAAGIG